MERVDSAISLETLPTALNEALVATLDMKEWSLVVEHWRSVVGEIAEYYESLEPAEQAALLRMMLNDLGARYDAVIRARGKSSRWNKLSIQGLVYQFFGNAVPDFRAVLLTWSPFENN